MSVTNSSLTEDTEMAEEVDGEKVVTMMDVLQEQQDFEDDANAVLGASDDKECTYSKGYIKRQAVYACLTCCGDARDDPDKRAGVCLACSLSCHENHELIELYTKRTFCCDCGNSKFNSNPCQFTPNKTDLNSENVYNQNFSGLYCTCNKPYPDPDAECEDEMIQCIICEDWLHSQHLDAKLPPMENYAEMICKGCMDRNEFLHDYSEFAVNIIENGHTVIGSTDASHLNGTDDINVDVTNDITDQSINADESITNDLSHIETNGLQEVAELEDECVKETNGDISEKIGDIIDVKTIPDNIEDTNVESMVGDGVVANDNLPELSVKDQEEIVKTPKVDSENVEQPHDKDKGENNTENEYTTESPADVPNATNEIYSQMPEITSETPEITSIVSNAAETGVNDKTLSFEANLDVPIEENSADPTTTYNVEPSVDSKPDEETIVEKSNLENKQSEETTVEESNLENKQTTSSEVETAEAAVESDQKPEEHSNIENTNLDNNLNSSSEEKDSEVNLEPHQETELNIETTENGDKPDRIESSETAENIDMKDVSSNDTVMADGDTSKTELSDTTVNTNEIEKEHKRKFSTEENEDDTTSKKLKLDSETTCIKPKNVKKIHKGATFWPGNFRQKLCKCNHCLTMYKDLSVLYLIDIEDTVSFYEALGKKKSNGTTQYEQGLEALSSLDRVQQINALTEYNLMRDKLLDFLKSFKERKEVVKEEDIKAFFAGMKPKREPDGVYFCR